MHGTGRVKLRLKKTTNQLSPVASLSVILNCSFVSYFLYPTSVELHPILNRL